MAESSDQPRTSTLQLSKQLLPAFLNYAWVAASDTDAGVTLKPLVLTVTSFKAYLSPKGGVPVPANAENPITLNQQKRAENVEWGVLEFNLTSAAGMPTTFDNATVVDCVLTLGGPTLHAEEWNDLYLLMKYEVDTA